MFHPIILKSSKRINNGTKSDETSNNRTTVQPLLNTWVSNEASHSINNNNDSNNNFNSNNINNNNNNMIFTSERRHNNIDIDNNTIISTDLKLNDIAGHYGSSSKTNYFYDIPDISQRAIAHVNMKVMYSVVDSILYKGEGLIKFSRRNNDTTINNRNTNNISTTPKFSKAGVEVEVAPAATTNDIMSLYKTTPSREKYECGCKQCLISLLPRPVTNLAYLKITFSRTNR